MTKEELRKLAGIDRKIRSASERELFKKHMLQQGLDPRSYYQEMEMSSPFVNTHRETTYQHEAMTLHSHTFYEILCCRSSCGAEYLAGPHRYSLQKGDILLIRPGVSHCAILPDPMTIPYERDIIWLTEAFLNSCLKISELPPVFQDQDFAAYLYRTTGTPWEFLCDMIHFGVKEEEDKQDAWQTRVVGNTMLLLSYFHQVRFAQTTQPTKTENTDLLDAILTHIENHYQQRLTLSDISRLFYISERTISSLFRNRLGVTFIQFLTQRRLIAAKDLIAKGILLEVVGEQAGFGDYSTFFRSFKAEFGISPREYKKLLESKSDAGSLGVFQTF